MTPARFPLRRLATRFGPEVWSYRRRIAASFALALVSVAAGLALPWPLKWLIDYVLPGKPFPASFGETIVGTQPLTASLALAGFFLLASLVYAGAGAAQRMLDARTREGLALRIRMCVLDHLLQLSPIFDAEQRSGELVSRLTNDAHVFVRLWTKTGPLLVRHGATVVFTVAAMFWLNPWLGWFALLVVPVLALLTRAFAHRLGDAARLKRTREGNFAGLTQELVQGLSDLQATGTTNLASARFSDEAKSALAAGVAESRIALGMEQWLQIAQGAIVAVALATGAYLVLEQHLTLGALTVAVSYLVQLLKPIEKINELASALARGLAAGERLLGILDREILVRDAADAKPLAVSRGVVEFCGVGFRYPETSRWVLRDLSVRFEPGTLTVIRGASGSGKSTLLQLIARLFDPARGSVLVDGEDIRGVTIDSLRGSLAVVSQRSQLFAGSVRAALRVREELTDDALWSALNDVGLAEFVQILPKGLDSQLGEDGANVSGGQRTRLCLARALLLDRPIVLLDEPTEGVDAEAQRLIIETLSRIAKTRTVIAATHRSALQEAAGCVYELDQGSLRALRVEKVAVLPAASA